MICEKERLKTRGRAGLRKETGGNTYIGQRGMCKHRKSFKDILMIIVFYDCWPVSLEVNKNTKQDLN